MFAFIQLVSLHYQNLAAMKDDCYELSFNHIIIQLSFRFLLSPEITS